MKYSPFFLFFFLLNCNTPESTNNTQPTETSGESKSNSNRGPGTVKNSRGCYIRVLQRDTLALHLQQEGNLVRGRLTFDNYEKDGSTGTVTGTIEGDIMKLIYSFQSEGMHSVMEVYFKISKNGLIHGVGEMQMKGDTAFYAQPYTVSYPDNNKLENIPCENLHSKYK
jgi:hypothetical protein